MSKRIVVETNLSLEEVKERFELQVNCSIKNPRKNTIGAFLPQDLRGNITDLEFWFDCIDYQWEDNTLFFVPRWHEFKGEVIIGDECVRLEGTMTFVLMMRLVYLPFVLFFAFVDLCLFFHGNFWVACGFSILPLYGLKFLSNLQQYYDRENLKFLTEIIDGKVVEYNGKIGCSPLK